MHVGREESFISTKTSTIRLSDQLAGLLDLDVNFADRITGLKRSSAPILSSLHDKKSFFAYSRSRTKSKVHIGPINTSSGNMTNSDAGLVNSFNDHFVNVFTAEDIIYSTSG